MNKFKFAKVLVSPHRRTIQTAINILKSHPQLEKGITFEIFPYAKEIVNNVNDLVVSRKELLDFLENIKKDNPQITFDLSRLDELGCHENLWFLNILQNSDLREPLIAECMKDPENMDHVLETVMEVFRKGDGVEGNHGVWLRVQKLKEIMKKELEGVQLTAPNHKILVVTHSRILQTFSASAFTLDEGVQQVSQAVVGKGSLVGARYFQNCEVLPYKAD